MPSAARPLPHAVPVGLELGPARVRAIDGRIVEVELESGVVAPATMALGIPYRPVVGDTLLVVGDGERRWVLGVVEGRGKVELEAEGDLELHARGGALVLGADRGVRVRGPSLEVTVDRFTVAATTMVEKLGTVFTRVREMLSVHAREQHVVVEETSLARAKKVAVVAEETASVNGKQILLG
jgi:hypothetical protein